MIAVLGGFDRWLLRPSSAGSCCTSPRCATSCRAWAASRKEQADARSLMTGRITDAYTNIATVKLFSHAQREAGFARAAMQEFMVTVHAQMRLVTRLRDRQPRAQHGADRRAPRASTLWLWTQGQVGVGAVAAATAMALRLNGISHWIMWEMAVAVRAHRHGAGRHQHAVAPAHAWSTRPMRSRSQVTRGEVRFEHVGFALRRERRGSARHRRPVAARSARARRSAWSAARAPASSTIVNLLLRFHDVEQRPHPDRRPGHRARHAGHPARADRHGHAGHLAAAPLGARQHRLRPARRRATRR